MIDTSDTPRKTPVTVVLSFVAKKLCSLSVFALVVAVLCAAASLWVLRQTGWQYHDMQWDEFETLSDNLGQPWLPSELRAKHIRLQGWRSPFYCIRVHVGDEKQSYVLFAARDDPAQAAWQKIREELDSLDVLRERLSRVAEDEDSNEGFKTKLESIRKRMGEINERAKARKDGKRTADEEVIAGSLKVELHIAIEESTVHVSVARAKWLRSQLHRLQERISKRPKELLPANSVFLAYSDGGELVDRMVKGAPDPLAAGLRQAFAANEDVMGGLVSDVGRDILPWLSPEEFYRHERDDLKKALGRCKDLADSIRAVVDGNVVVEGRLVVVDSGVRDKYKSLSDHGAPQYVLLAGHGPPDVASRTLLIGAGGALAVALLSVLLLLACSWLLKRQTLRPGTAAVATRDEANPTPGEDVPVGEG